MASAFAKETIRSITQSIGRFAAIAIISLLGAGFYGGLRMAAPDMRLAGDQFFDAGNLYDISVTTELGADDSTADALRDVKGVKAIMSVRSGDAMAQLGENSHVLRIQSLDVDAALTSDTSDGVHALSQEEGYLNRPLLLEGAWPSEKDEIVISAHEAKALDVSIGDTVVLEKGTSDLDDTFTTTEFTVTGFVNSSEYIAMNRYGPTSLGTGEVELYAYAPSAAFAQDCPYAAVCVTVDGARELQWGSASYEAAVGEVRDRIREEVAARIADERYEAAQKLAKDKLAEAREQVRDSRTMLGRMALWSALADEDSDSGRSGNSSSSGSLGSLMGDGSTGDLSKLTNGSSSQDTGELVAEAEKKLADAQSYVDDMEVPEVFVMTRDKNPGAASLDSDADGITQIASLFPFMFFLVAALVSLTSMTRMVDEERMVIGTHKALGYSKGRIIGKYLLYGTLASGLGSVIGVVVIGKLLPLFIMTAYQISYANPMLPLPLEPATTIKAIGLSVGVCALATWWAGAASLREKPASLMLPAAPKAGKRIILERIGALWKRFSFSQKVTARNLLRYKRRFFMAVIGVAGCTARLVIGFGLRDAIGGIVSNQYEELIGYDLVIRVDDDITKRQWKAVEQTLQSQDVSRYTRVSEKGMIVRGPDASVDDQRITVVVPSDPKTISDYVTLRDRVSGQAIALDGDVAVITEKSASVVGAQNGGEVMLFELNDVGDAKGEGFAFPVGGLAENYLGHYAYVSPDVYEAATGGLPAYSTVYAVLSDGADGDRLANELLDLPGVNTASFVADQVEAYEDMLDVMNKLIYIIVAAAAALAFVVLYNLTYINITERVREIATLKVLGFTRQEVNAYIFREIVVMSLIGAAIGCVAGAPLTTYIAIAAETPEMMFGRAIEPLSFVLSFGLTMVFTVLVAVSMHRKLASVSMVESLKSVD